MKFSRYKPVGWRGESHRHYLAAKGIPTRKKYYAVFVYRKSLGENNAGDEMDNDVRLKNKMRLLPGLHKDRLTPEQQQQYAFDVIEDDLRGERGRGGVPKRDVVQIRVTDDKDGSMRALWQDGRWRFSEKEDRAEFNEGLIQTAPVGYAYGEAKHNLYSYEQINPEGERTLTELADEFRKMPVQEDLFRAAELPRVLRDIGESDAAKKFEEKKFGGERRVVKRAGEYKLVVGPKTRMLKEFYVKKNDSYARWRKLVNMSPTELERFKASEEGKVAGLSRKEASSMGIRSGRDSAAAIIRMKRKPRSEWTGDDEKWMRRQVSFVSRMKGNPGKLYDEKGRPTRKLLALKIWGHNPEKA